MKTNILATALALSDQDLLARLEALAGQDRETSAEIVGHLAALEMRPALYAAQGYGSLGYCTQALRLSEDSACNRIGAARACRRFPAILDLLASGSLTLTGVRLLAPHLTVDNHDAVLAKAANGTWCQLEALAAELAPRPDVVASVRRLSIPPPTPSLSTPAPAVSPSSSAAAAAVSSVPFAMASADASLPAARLTTPRPIVQATAPQRYRVQFTMGQETHDRLRRVQALLRREIPDGDPGAIFARALVLLLEKVEKTKLAATSRPRSPRPIRRAADDDVGAAAPSRHIPADVERMVWRRDGAQCTFVAPTGRRCSESAFLDRGRDAGFPAPPAQIRACAASALGSCLRY